MMQRSKHSKRFILGMAILAIGGGATVGGVFQRGRPEPQVGKTQDAGIDFRLRDGDRRKASNERLKPSPATMLSDADADAILKRVPALPNDGSDQVPFRAPENSLPPPRAGVTVPATFPPAPAGQKPAVDAGPIAVRSITPNGEVGPIDRITVSFNQPMVPLSSVDSLLEQVPARISPATDGKWRWLGTQTLVFEFGSGQRLRNATDYVVTVPAGTRSTSGKTLDKTVTEHIYTPLLQVVASGPQGGGHPLDPTMFITWNQEINQAAALRAVRVTVDGARVAIRAADPTSKDATYQKRTLTFKPLRPLPTGAKVGVEVPPGQTFGEGPRPSMMQYNNGFSTYGAFKLTRSQCTWDSNQPCRPDMPWTFQFTNPVDPKTITRAHFDISPKVDQFELYPGGNSITLQGAFKGRTTYTVRIKSGIKDAYGQQLAATEPITFKLVSGFPNIIGPRDPMIIADPAAPARITFNTYNVRTFRAELYQVTPDDWNAWIAWLERGSTGNPPGTLLRSEDIAVGGEMDRWTETGVPLASALNSNGRGNVIVRWSASLDYGTRVEKMNGACWVQATKLGVSAHRDQDKMQVWVTDLLTGKAVKGASVSVIPSGQTGVSDGTGVAGVSLNQTIGKRIRVSAAGETAFLPSAMYSWDGNGFVKGGYADMPLWFAYTDRGLYRPGETVSIKGIHRVRPGAPKSRLIIPTAKTQVAWQLMDSQGNEISKGTAPVTKAGGITIKTKLPSNMHTGNATLAWGDGSVSFNVQEFRRPDFEVTSRSETQGAPVMQDSGIDFSTSASYYAGGSLAGAAVDWNVSVSPTTYTPPGHSEFTFGTWVPWWRGGGFASDMMDAPIGRFSGIVRPGFGGGTVKQHSGTLASDGTHWLHVDVDSIRPASPVTVTATASIQDVNRQARTTTATQLVHAADTYVGVHFPVTFVDAGQSFKVSTIAVTPDGKVVPNAVIRLKAFRKVWGLDVGEYKETERDVVAWTVSGGRRMETSVVPQQPGSWTLVATITDTKGRTNRTERTFWVSGEDKLVQSQKQLGQDELTMIPSKPEVSVGGTAEVLLQAPYGPTEVLIQVVGRNVLTTQRMTLRRGGTVIKLPVTEEWLPNVTLQVHGVGSKSRAGAAKGVIQPAFANGSIPIKVSKAEKKLVVTLSPEPAAIEPGGATKIGVMVRDSAGKPVEGADVSVVVVDDSVLSLAGWVLGDPLAAFYPERYAGVQTLQLRSWLKLEDPNLVPANDKAKFQNGAMFGGMPGGGGRGGIVAEASRMAVADSIPASAAPMIDGDQGIPRKQRDGDAPAELIRERVNLDPLAVFSTDNQTDAKGQTTVPVTVPDNLTRYRIAAVAATVDQFGTSESQLLARLPLMARLSAPRFLNLGDQFELPVVVQNQTEQPMTVDVAVRGVNTAFTKGRGRRVSIPAGDRVEVRFPAESIKPGTAKFQVAVVAGRYADAQSVSIPVFTPASSESFATYGIVDAGATLQSVQLPKNVRLDQGGLDITTTSTALSELTDAAIYLHEYPFGCAEQIASRVISTVSLRDILVAFKAPNVPSDAAMNASLEADIKRLSELQNTSGGFGFWTRGEREWPYLGVHVAHALVRAKAKGVKVPDAMLNLSLAYCAGIENHIPAEYGVQAKRMIRAYAYYVRSLSGTDVSADATRLLTAVPLSELGPEAVGWLVSASAGGKGADTGKARDAALAWFDRSVTQTAGSAHFAFSYGDNDWFVLASNRRADAIVLDAIIAVQPKNDLIPKLVRGLLDGRRNGIWGNTQENVWSLLACDRYFRTFENVTPDFVARVWLGETYAGSSVFKGRSAQRQLISVPMQDIAKIIGKPGETKPLTLGHSGPNSPMGAGRMYYRLGLRVVPENLQLPASDQGFRVERVYTGIDDPKDVTKSLDGSWVIKAGARVRVTVTVVATTRHYHVAVSDPLPAGLEPEFAQTSPVIYPPGGWWRGWWSGWEHTNLRDDRGEAFTSLLWEGVHTFTYTTRATTPGKFVVPPAKAEEMYAPETFGRSAGTKVQIVE